jgi:hypothetical protein
LRRVQTLLLATGLVFLGALAGCFSPYTPTSDNRVTDGLALGAPQIRLATGIANEDLQLILASAMQDGFVPLIFSSNGQGFDKLKYYIGTPLHAQLHNDSPVYFPYIHYVNGDEVRISISIPSNRIAADSEDLETQITAIASFSNKSWNRGMSSAYMRDGSGWSDSQRLISMNWQLSGIHAGAAWTAEVQQPALRYSLSSWEFGYGWLLNEGEEFARLYAVSLAAQ